MTKNSVWRCFDEVKDDNLQGDRYPGARVETPKGSRRLDYSRNPLLLLKEIYWIHVNCSNKYTIYVLNTVERLKLRTNRAWTLRCTMRCQNWCRNWRTADQCGRMRTTLNWVCWNWTCLKAKLVNCEIWIQYRKIPSKLARLVFILLKLLAYNSSRSALTISVAETPFCISRRIN